MAIKYSPQSGTLVFRTSELVEEFEAAEACLSPFLTAEGASNMTLVRRALETVSSKPVGTCFEWGTRRTGPIVTSPNLGAHHGTGGANLRAEIDFAWEMRTLHDNGSRKRLRTSSHVLLNGLASTRIWLSSADSDSDSPQLAMWRFEVGDPVAPGCFFHVQVMGDELCDTLSKLFPKSLDIPRLPGLIFYPTDCIDFVLGELHQSDWRRRAERTTREMNRWRPIQQFRLARTLAWQAQIIKDIKVSPWAALKRAKPPPDLFLDRPPQDLYEQTS